MEPVRVGDEESGNAVVMPHGVDEVEVERSEAFSVLQLNQNISTLSLDEPDRVVAEPDDCLMPTINRQVLQELDQIEGNIQVMHDLYLEPGLRIQPKEKSRSNSQDAEYWQKVEEDIKSLNEYISVGKRGKCSARLCVLLSELRIITEDMHPESDKVKNEIQDCFDLDMLVAELETGQFDMNKFGQAFADLLQANCAPKRDKFIVKLRQLALTNDVIGYLKQALILLEGMKIDLVNYRLGKLRQTLGNTIVPLEKTFWSTHPEIPLRDSRAWLNYYFRPLNKEVDKESRIYTAFVKTAVNVALGLEDRFETIPETFALDEVRLGRMQTESQDLCIVALLLSFKRQFLGASPCKELKESLFHHLEQENADIDNLAASLIQHIEKARGSELPALQRSALLATVNKVVDPEGKAYKILESRLAEYLSELLWKRDKKPAGFEETAEELAEFAEAFVAMARVNWAVHQDTYRLFLAK